jgi:HNH endonuclease
MSRYISESLKKRILQKANGCCEYCLMENNVSFISHQIDHIISIKHGGLTRLDNLAYACFSCNNSKGSDIGTILLPNKIFIRLLIQEKMLGMTILRLNMVSFMPKQILQRLQLKY